MYDAYTKWHRFRTCYRGQGLGLVTLFVDAVQGGELVLRLFLLLGMGAARPRRAMALHYLVLRSDAKRRKRSRMPKGNFLVTWGWRK